MAKKSIYEQQCEKFMTEQVRLELAKLNQDIEPEQQKRLEDEWRARRRGVYWRKQHQTEQNHVD